MGYTKEQRDAKATKTITTDEEKKAYTDKGAKLPDAPTMRRPERIETSTPKLKAGWCAFTAKTRCYIEGAQLEGGQEITLSPTASYKERNNDHLILVAGEIPDTLTTEQIAELETGDPRVGKATKEFTLVKPA